MKFVAIILLLVVLCVVPSHGTATPTALMDPADALRSTSASGWRIEPVGYFGGSSEPGLALDASNAPHILYCPPGQVWYASRPPSGWVSEFVTPWAGGGVCGELAMGPRDVPHITTPWVSSYGGELYGTRANGTWDLHVYPGGLLGAVNARGEPQVVTYWRLGSGRYSFRYLTLTSGMWIHEDVETFLATGTFGSAWASLVLDASDEPHVLYYDDRRGDVRYAFRNETGWHVEVVEHIGALNAYGRHGSLALDSAGDPHAAYAVRTQPTRIDTFYAVRGPSGWTREFVAIGLSPSLALRSDGVPVLLFRKGLPNSLQIATKESGWTFEAVPDLPAGPTIWQFPTMVLDRCDNPHVAMYGGTSLADAGIYYATKGGPCERRSVRVDVDPDTLNLKSNGRYVTATVTVENASAADVDATTLALNGIPASRVWRWGDALIAKFDRGRFAATLSLGTNLVTLAGEWKDGVPFTATDTIRVIRPGK